MDISKGLVIDDPWIGYILDGSKTWEMRSSSTSHRGWFALIRKGTGTVCGIACLVDCGASLTPAEMLASRQHHQIPPEMICSEEVAKWNRPWKLENVRRLVSPVPYKHRNGAVTWVLLDDVVSQSISAQLPDLCQATDALSMSANFTMAREKSKKNEPPSYWPVIQAVRLPFGKGVETIFGESVLTDGNIKNSHIYLRSFAKKFPADVIGGSNNAERATREVTVDWGGPNLAHTDIDGEKLFFRSRAWVKPFFKLNDARAGNRVQVLMVDPYTYRVRLVSS